MTVVPTDAVVVLDVDDTVYLERDYVRSGFSAVGESWPEITGLADTLWQGFLDGVRGDAFNRALQHHQVHPTPERVAAMVACYRSHHPNIAPEPDVRRFLDRAGERPVAVITDGPAESQRAKVEALGLVGRAYPVILTADLGPGRSKPSPVPYELVEETLGVDSSRCWYVGDNPTKDFSTPLDRSWQAVRVNRTGALHHGVPTPPGVQEVGSFDELRC